MTRRRLCIERAIRLKLLISLGLIAHVIDPYFGPMIGLAVSQIWLWAELDKGAKTHVVQATLP